MTKVLPVNNGRQRPFGTLVVLLLLIAAAFVSGLMIGYLKLPPTRKLAELAAPTRDLLLRRGGNERSAFADMIFSEPIIADRMYPAITSIDGVRAANEEIFIDARHFATAYKNLRVVDAATLRVGNSRVLRVGYELAGRRYTAFAYFAAGKPTAYRGAGATLVIPSSGENVSSGMLQEDSSVPGHRALRAFSRSGDDLYIFIKPNEDILAFHNGREKLNELAITNYHLNRGGSYSVSYLVQSMAITKHLQALYKSVVVAGHSQGGTAALLNALQSEPAAAVVSSGYTMLNNVVEFSAPDQLIIPTYDFEALFNPHLLAKHLSQSRTRFLFTWGRREEGPYGIDAAERLSCSKLQLAPNVTCLIHQGKHVLPVEQIRGFLQPQSKPRRTRLQSQDAFSAFRDKDSESIVQLGKGRGT